MPEKLDVVLILEIMGKPADYVKQTLTDIVSNIEKTQNVKIINKKIAEPKKLEHNEGGQEIFTSYAEVEIEVSLQMLMAIIFTYMPSHIDIITPEKVEIKNNDLNSFFNELARRLHQYDEIARTVLIERQILANKIKQASAIKVEEVKPEEKIKKKPRKKKT